MAFKFNQTVRVTDAKHPAFKVYGKVVAVKGTVYAVKSADGNKEFDVTEGQLSVVKNPDGVKFAW